MAVLEEMTLSLTIPLYQDPPGVLRVGKSRVLLELVLRAYQRGASPREIVEMYDALDVGDVYAVIAYFLAHPDEMDEYLRVCQEKAAAVRRAIEASQPPGPSREDLLARKNLAPVPHGVRFSSREEWTQAIRQWAASHPTRETVADWSRDSVYSGRGE